MLETFHVPPQFGRVCYLTEGQTRWSVTVECADTCRAFRFDTPCQSKLKIGDWVTVFGLVRMDPSLRKDGSPMEKNLLYIHKPYDGSNRLDWLFFDLRIRGWRREPSPDIAEVLKEVSVATNIILQSWDEVSTDRIHKAIRAWEKASELMRPVLKQRVIEEQEMHLPIKALDLEV